LVYPESSALSLLPSVWCTDLLDKAHATLQKLGAMDGVNLDTFLKLSEDVKKAWEALQEDVTFSLDDAPADFLDPFLCTIMREPVKLPNR
jgi:hypothetical protein